MDARKPKVGDVAEVRTPEGLAYLQYTHDGKGDGELVRVLPGLYGARPNLEVLVSQRELYFIFYTLKYAMREKQSEILCNLPVPEWARPEPLMRHASGRTSEGKVTGWRIVPALRPLTIDFLKRTPVIRELTQEQKRLSIHLLRPHPVMVKELARGWTPEHAEDIEDQDRAESRARKAGHRLAPDPSEAMRHYLYFRTQTDAEYAGEQMRDRGYDVEVRKSADGENWLTLAKGARPNTKEETDRLRNEMESFAAQHSGNYDGWEIATESSGRLN
jgi:hypothetical protein